MNRLEAEEMVLRALLSDERIAALLSILIWLCDVHRGIERCGTSTCFEVAIARFRWPGKPWMYACERHRAWATHVAGVLGFELEQREALVPVDRPDGSALRFAGIEID